MENYDASRVAEAPGMDPLNDGGPERAANAYREAVASEHPDYAPKAAVNLGILLAGQGEVEEACAAFRQAIDSGHPDAAPAAGVGLGRLLRKQGQFEQAAEAYRKAMASGHHDQAPKAAFNLGNLLRGQGQHEQAADAYRQAMASGHHDAAPKAAISLGDLLAQQGQLKQAEAAYRKAIDSGRPDYASSAADNLEKLLAKHKAHRQALHTNDALAILDSLLEGVLAVEDDSFALRPSAGPLPSRPAALTNSVMRSVSGVARSEAYAAIDSVISVALAESDEALRERISARAPGLAERMNVAVRTEARRLLSGKDDVGSTDFKGADLSKSILVACNLKERCFDDAILAHSTLMSSDLTRASLRRANLLKANLRSANLENADLTGANLAGSDLSSANLENADLTDANLVGCDLSSANLRGAVFHIQVLQGAIWNSRTEWDSKVEQKLRGSSSEIRPGVYVVE